MTNKIYSELEKIVRQKSKQRSLRKRRELFLTWIYYENVIV